MKKEFLRTTLILAVAALGAPLGAQAQVTYGATNVGGIKSGSVTVGGTNTGGMAFSPNGAVTVGGLNVGGVNVGGTTIGGTTVGGITIGGPVTGLPISGGSGMEPLHEDFPTKFVYKREFYDMFAKSCYQVDTETGGKKLDYPVWATYCYAGPTTFVWRHKLSDMFSKTCYQVDVATKGHKLTEFALESNCEKIDADAAAGAKTAPQQTPTGSVAAAAGPNQTRAQ